VFQELDQPCSVDLVKETLALPRNEWVNIGNA
jgi:hypothetical protein